MTRKHKTHTYLMVGVMLSTHQLSNESVDIGEMVGWFDMEFPKYFGVLGEKDYYKLLTWEVFDLKCVYY